MKILIQHTGTSLFLNDCNQWTRNDRQARSFWVATAAQEFARKQGLHDVSAFYKFNRHPELNFSMPIVDPVVGSLWQQCQSGLNEGDSVPASPRL